MPKVERSCLYCNNKFLVREYQLKIGTGKFCSHACHAKYRNPPIPIEKRFWNKVQIGASSECWQFIGYKNKDGYGRVGISNGKTEGAHRIAFKLCNGEIPKDMVVLHTCDNPSCCNPNHLKLGTQGDNIQDMTKKKRGVYQHGEDSHFSKLTEKEVQEIKETYSGKRGDKIRLSKKYKVYPTSISNILNKKTWNRLI